MGNYDFGTDGNCFARGSVDNPVLFTYGFKYAGQGWNFLGIYMEGEFNKILNFDSLIFNNCIFEYCKQPYFEVQRPLSQFYFEMENCVFRHMPNVIRIQCISSTDQSTLDVGKRIIVKNCVFHDIQSADTLSGIEFVSPVVYVHDFGAPWPCNAPSVQIINNIFYRERWGGIECSFAYNCYDSTYIDTLFMDDSTCVFGDPKFVDITNGNYRLQPSSPCIGAGINGEDMGIVFEK